MLICLGKVYFYIAFISLVSIIGISFLFSHFSNKTVVDTFHILQIEDYSSFISTTVSIIVAGIITAIIFYYQEKGQQQMQVGLIDIDLLSKNDMDKDKIQQKSILYGTIYGLKDLVCSISYNLDDISIPFYKKKEYLKSFLDHNYFYYTEVNADPYKY
jgi:hypothetical protein